MEKITEILDCETKLLRAVKENDLKSLDELLHPDLLFVDAMGQIITKEDDMQNYGSGQIQIDYIEASEQNIRLISNVAVVTVKIKIKGKYLEHLLDETFQYIRVWIQHSNSWKIIGGSSIRV